jgi:hypothetical protein
MDLHLSCNKIVVWCWGAWGLPKWQPLSWISYPQHTQRLSLYKKVIARLIHRQCRKHHIPDVSQLAVCCHLVCSREAGVSLPQYSGDWPAENTCVTNDPHLLNCMKCAMGSFLSKTAILPRIWSCSNQLSLSTSPRDLNLLAWVQFRQDGEI